jgi:putative ATPase
VQSDLFGDEPIAHIPREGIPLAERMRPRSLDEIVGQEELLAPGRPLREAIERDRLQSIILWGPPGTGKTTIARLIAERTQARFVAFSAVLSGIKDIKDVMASATAARRAAGQRTILFVDEIHRFNKAQQDAFLPHVEGGSIVLIGATTENPSFEVNAALLSRSRVFVLHGLDEEALGEILRRGLSDPERGLGADNVTAAEDALALIGRASGGDARSALNLLELAAASAPAGEDGARRIDAAHAEQVVQRRMLLYDKGGEEHYNLISALHKSMRNSDPDAAVYWLARMLEAGEDPLYIARRMVRFASEDVGNADPQALAVAVAAKDAAHFIGMPEGNTALAQAAIYLATAPKSNAIYTAYSRAADDARRGPAAPVPLHLRNAPTKLMKDLEYGRGYQYAHDEPDAVAAMTCLPDALRGRRYYRPTTRGFEKEIKRRLDAWEALKATRASESAGGTERTDESGSGGGTEVRNKPFS